MSAQGPKNNDGIYPMKELEAFNLIETNFSSSEGEGALNSEEEAVFNMIISHELPIFLEPCPDMLQNWTQGFERTLRELRQFDRRVQIMAATGRRPTGVDNGDACYLMSLKEYVSMYKIRV